MSKNTNNLPYFKNPRKNQREEKILADFLLRKFRPKIKEKFPQHFLIQPITFKTLNFIKETSKKFPYFLRFDIRLYYPSINHQILLKNLPKTHLTISRCFKKYLKKDIPEFLSQSPYGKGLSIGSRLSYILAGIFLLDLDLKIKTPFLRQNDDYLIFCKNRWNAEKLLKNAILPELKELNLEINEKKLRSGKFWQEKVNFIGFEFYSGYIRISEEKIEEFKKRIAELTHLTRKKSEKELIKSLNNQILGFGHYYKLASCKRVFEELDAFIRSRLRRYIQRNKDSRDKQANLILTNAALKSMGLKSLEDIYQKYRQKNRYKFKNRAKFKARTGKPRRGLTEPSLEEIEAQYRQKKILEQLIELTDLVKKLERKIRKLGKKL